MFGIVGILLIGLGLLVARAAIAGVRMQDPPRWTSEGMQAYVLVPFIVTSIVIGLGAFGTWLLGGHWQSETPLGWGGMAIAVAGYFLAGRALRIWAASQPVALPAAQPAGALGVIEGGKPQDPRRPPQRPRLKKAA